MAFVHMANAADVVVGAVVGDALGVPFEGMGRDERSCDGMEGHGAHDMPAGTFSDDSSMTLATVDSLRACEGRVDAPDMRRRFLQWLEEGAYTADGAAFSVGTTTRTALERGRGCEQERSNGNGSLMRVSPLALVDATDAQVEFVSAITHAHPLSKACCAAYVHVLRDLLAGASPARAVAACLPETGPLAAAKDAAHGLREGVRSSGYVLDTLGAALWCLLHAHDYASCVRAAVELGGDTDTTACVAGALAGAVWGLDAIPKEWVQALRGKAVVRACVPGPPQTPFVILPVREPLLNL